MKQIALKQKRVEWVDIARGVGIIVVVFGHVLRGIENANIVMPSQFFLWSDRLVYSFHMPLFFVLSGLFFLTSLQKQPLGTYLHHRFRTLAYPYFLWSLLQTSAETWFSQHTNGSIRPAELLQLLWQPRAHFWFLHNLFIILVIAAVAVTVASRPKWTLIIVAFALFFSPWRYPSVNYFFAFFVIGILVSPYLFQLDWQPAHIGRWFLVCLAAWLLCASVMILNNIMLGFLPVVTALLGVAAVVLGSMWLSDKSPPAVLVIFGRNSLFIYLAHVLAGSGIRIVLIQLGFTNLILHIVAGTVGGLFLPLILYRLTVLSGSSLLLAPPQLFKVQRQTVRN